MGRAPPNYVLSGKPVGTLQNAVWQFPFRNLEEVIRSTLANVRLNPELPDGSFRFTPPAGADVFPSPSQP